MFEQNSAGQNSAFVPTTHSKRGANLIDRFNEVSQSSPVKVRTVCIAAVFNDNQPCPRKVQLNLMAMPMNGVVTLRLVIIIEQKKSLKSN